jgi:hypothetical protein
MNPGQRLGRNTALRAPDWAGDLKAGAIISGLRRLAKGTNRALGVLFQDDQTRTYGPFSRAQAVANPIERRMPFQRFGPSPTAILQASKPTYLVIALSALAGDWPEAIRREILELNLAHTSLSLPAGVVRRALKQGRIAFSWRLLRSSLKPTPPSMVSRHDAMQLELPIKTIASLFFALQSKSKIPDRLTSDEALSGLETDDTLALDPQSIATPCKPAEVVTRAMAFKGVAGAMVLLPDGWIVASRLPAHVDGDALAAFLPQIIDKLDECGEELGMHQLTRLNFALGGTPWNVFRLRNLIFAVFGAPDGPLPGARLTALAAELDNDS